MSFELPPFVYAGFRQGEQAGRVFVRADGRELAEFPLRYARSVDVAAIGQTDAWQRIRRAWFMVNRYSYVYDYSV